MSLFVSRRGLFAAHKDHGRQRRLEDDGVGKRIERSIGVCGKVDASRYNDVLMPASCFRVGGKKAGNEARQP